MHKYVLFVPFFYTHLIFLRINILRETREIILHIYAALKSMLHFLCFRQQILN